MWVIEELELNNSQVRLTCGNTCQKAGQMYIQSTASLWWKECRESVKRSKMVILMEEKFKKYFVYFGLVWFGLVPLFNGISTLFRLFNAKAILLEEQ